MTEIRKDGPDAGDVHVPTVGGQKRKKTRLQQVAAMLEKAIRRWPAGTSRGGQFAPTNAGLGGGGMAARAGRSVPPVPDTSRFDQSHAGVRRIQVRMAQMRADAEAGNIDAIRNMTTSRGNSYQRTVDDYRTALLAHADPVARVSRLRGTMPTAPDITGANMQNSALVAARRYVNRVQQAAQADNPLEALQQIPVVGVANTNRYNRQAQGYHVALIQHFSDGEATVQIPNPPARLRVVQGQAASRATPAPQRPADPGPVTVRVASPRPAGEPIPQAAPAGISHNDVIHSHGGVTFHRGSGRSAQHDAAFGGSMGAARNTTFLAGTQRLSVDDAAVSSIAANPDRMRVSELGFVPRPNVPQAGTTVTREGLRGANGVTPWPTDAARHLATAYLAQPTDLQVRARDYQNGTWKPETPERRAARADAARAEEARLAEAQRQAALGEETRRARIPAEFRSQARPGHNVSRTTADVQSNRFVTTALNTKDAAAQTAKTLIADYGQGVRFSASVTVGGTSAQMSFNGSDGTEIRRQFTANADGSVSVYHAYFKAGTRGEGAGKRFFRVAMGEYMSMGVKDVGVTANLDVGGYAWARYGYLPASQGTWDGLRSQLKGKLERMRERITPQAYEQMTATLNNPDRRSLWKVSDFRTADGRSLGKDLLLGTSWSGKIDLNDREQMSRFTAYVSQG